MTSYEKINKGVELFIEGFGETIKEVVERIGEAMINLAESVKPMLKRKISKKKFCKLLQASGIQRNEINRIVCNNKEPYTYERLYYLIGGYKCSIKRKNKTRLINQKRIV